MSAEVTAEQLREALTDVDLPASRGRIEEALAEKDLVEDAVETVTAAIDGDRLVADGEGTWGTLYTVGDTDTTDPTPTPDGEETTKQGGEVTREEAVDALRDVIRFYHDRVDDTIADHTEAGDHPERPTTAREYFTDRRGWDDATVEDLRLGWAPADHVDELVAYLHDRGHTREAMLATGAIGESDDGGLYTTFSGRYVLPYYDADGRPAYAIARATGALGGGGAGYDGHPRDYQAGKYAKLRHTDERVPFEEPIYGLDTLTEDDEVVIAEGIADAITAREAGYAVLSPVAREFKKKHFDPLAEALEAHDVDRVTVVADADLYGSDDEQDHAPESIGEAVDRRLVDVPAGLSGALRTADGLGDRAEGLEVRVTAPPVIADVANDLDEWVTEWDGGLGVLLATARPPEAFDAFDTVTEEDDDVADAFEDFDAEEYEADATTSDETTDEIRDLFAAIDRLDAQRVADRTIARGWKDSRGDRRTMIPTWAPAGYDGTAVYCDREKFVDTGDRGGYGGPVAMAAIDAGLVSDRHCPDAVEGETWFKAVDHLRDLGFDIPRLDRGNADDEDDEEGYRRDPREVEATVDARRAWEAAGRVTAEDLDADLPELEAADDVVHAVALAEDMIADVEEPLDGDTYPQAYRVAREKYGAPLPEYYTERDAIAEFDAVLDVIRETTFFDLDRSALASTVTAQDDDVGGEAARALNPAWRESESGESVLVFPSGTVWDADTERVLDVARFAALDAGVIDTPADDLDGERFLEAYRVLREDLDAPLPRWDPASDSGRDLTPQIPPAEELVAERDLDGVHGDRLDAAREEVETLVGGAVDGAEEATVVETLPATGKTTGTVKTARDQPLTYLAPRKELQAQAVEKADTWDVDEYVLPVLAEERPREEVLQAAIAHVREAGKSKLRDRWEVLDAAVSADREEDDAPITPSDIFEEDDEDDEEVDLDRATCPTANGEHGPAWALAVHVARALGYKPVEIHNQAEGLFGAPLPCEDGEDATCAYSDAWDEVADREDPPDLLIGSYGHAYVDSVRTVYGYDHATGETTHDPRSVVLDEFPGEAFAREFGEEALDGATWLARALREDVADRRDMIRADLDGDEWVTRWLDGEGDAVVAGIVDGLEAAAATLDARDTAREIREEYDDDLLEDLGLRGVLGRVVDGDTPLEALREATDVDPERPGSGVARWAAEEVLTPLADAQGRTLPDTDAVDAAPFGGDLAQLVTAALEAADAGDPDDLGLVEAALEALKGGVEGCRTLAAWADDGYAHPDAVHFLTAVVTPTGEDGAGERIHTDAWAFDPEATEGTVLDRVATTDRATTLLDRNDHGAVIHAPPAWEDRGGHDVPVVGLDATARAELWETALGREVRLADIFDTDEERAEFLEAALDLRVIRASDDMRFYEGSPTEKDLDGDVALLETLADEYAGVEAPRQRGEEAVAVGTPACITTHGVRAVLEDDPRLDDVVDAWENYGNVKGSNELGDHRLAAILGTQHYGDDAVERFAALAGEEADTSRGGGRGSALDYGGAVANAYLDHMTEDQTMQAILRFARGDSGATVVARTAALREDLPVVGEGQVVETWSDTATAIARAWRRLGERFTVADVADEVDVTKRQVRRVLDELDAAGYVSKVDTGPGVANEYDPVGQPNAGEVDLGDRPEAGDPGRTATKQYYTNNVRVFGGKAGDRPTRDTATPITRGAPPAPDALADGAPPG